MAQREFTDSRGVLWRVWDLTPERVRPIGATAPSLQLDAFTGEYEEGWLCFQSERERRRLPHYPPDWTELSDARLEELLGAAVPAPTRGADETDTGIVRRYVERRRPDSVWREGMPRRRRTDPPPERELSDAG
jgi:hypothetical protein